MTGTEFGILQEYVAECERKIIALQRQVDLLEQRLEATISIATREATGRVVGMLTVGLDAADD